MDLLVLGGTEFAGRAVAEDAVAREWRVTDSTGDGIRPAVGLDPEVERRVLAGLGQPSS